MLLLKKIKRESIVAAITNGLYLFLVMHEQNLVLFMHLGFRFFSDLHKNVVYTE